MSNNFNTTEGTAAASASRLKRTLLAIVLGIGLPGAMALDARVAQAQGTAPTITSANAATVAENRTAVIDVNATDDSDSEGSGLAFGLSGGADQALFNIETATGVVTFKSAPDYERPADNGADNKYDIQVAVTDSSNLTSTQDIVITVRDLACTASSLTAPTEAVFNAALDCYKELSTGSFTLDVTGSFTLTTSPFDISNHNSVALTINGGGHTIDGAGQYTPITVSAGTMTVNNITLQNGSGSNGGAVHIASGADATITNAVVRNSSASKGGGIWNGGTVTVSNSTVSGSSSASGGGLRNNGNATVSNSTFSGNSTTRSGEGGGISNYGTATVSGSTFSGNSGAFGAALYTRGALNVNNSTISANAASALAGGIYIFWTGSATATNTTITGSSANVGGGILNNGGTMNMRNSIVANSTRGSNCYGAIGNTNSLTDDGSCDGLTQSSSISLADLADNGCATQHMTPTGLACVSTHALNAGSAALDAGDATVCASAGVDSLDQRGVARPQGSSCEVGAFEVQDTAPVITSSNTIGAAENQTAVIDVNVTDDYSSEGSGLTFGLNGGADQALFSVDATTGVVTFNTAPDYETPTDQGAGNSYDIQVLVTDAGGLTATQAIVVTVTNVAEAPTAANDSFEVTDGAPITVTSPGLLGNDQDPEGNTITATVVAGPQNGTLSLNTDGSFTYTPNDEYNGTDSFTYNANDGGADSNTATVTLAVTAYEPQCYAVRAQNGSMVQFCL